MLADITVEFMEGDEEKQQCISKAKYCHMPFVQERD
jgi:hypothetical protein